MNVKSCFFEVRVLRGIYDTAELCFGALVFYLTVALGGAMIVY